MTTPVEPVELITRTAITSVDVSVTHLVLFKSVTVMAKLFDGEKLVESRMFMFEGDDYTNWKDDDGYLLKLTLSRLGLVAKEPEPAPAPAPASEPATATTPELVPEST